MSWGHGQSWCTLNEPNSIVPVFFFLTFTSFKTISVILLCAYVEMRIFENAVTCRQVSHYFSLIVLRDENFRRCGH